jgi:hypothetical protein
MNKMSEEGEIDKFTFKLNSTGTIQDIYSKNPIISTIAILIPDYPSYDVAHKRNLVAKNIQTYFQKKSKGDQLLGNIDNLKLSVIITFYTLKAEVILGADKSKKKRREIFDLLAQDIKSRSKLISVMKEIVEIRRRKGGSPSGTSSGTPS